MVPYGCDTPSTTEASVGHIKWMPLFSAPRKFTLPNGQRRGKTTPDSEDLNIAKHRDYLDAMKLHVKLLADVKAEIQIRYELLRKLYERKTTLKGIFNENDNDMAPSLFLDIHNDSSNVSADKCLRDSSSSSTLRPPTSDSPPDSRSSDEHHPSYSSFAPQDRCFSNADHFYQQTCNVDKSSQPTSLQQPSDSSSYTRAEERVSNTFCCPPHDPSVLPSSAEVAMSPSDAYICTSNALVNDLHIIKPEEQNYERGPAEPVSVIEAAPAKPVAEFAARSDVTHPPPPNTALQLSSRRQVNEEEKDRNNGPQPGTPTAVVDSCPANVGLAGAALQSCSALAAQPSSKPDVYEQDDSVSKTSSWSDEYAKNHDWKSNFSVPQPSLTNSTLLPPCFPAQMFKARCSSNTHQFNMDLYNAITFQPSSGQSELLVAETLRQGEKRLLPFKSESEEDAAMHAKQLVPESQTHKTKLDSAQTAIVLNSPELVPNITSSDVCASNLHEIKSEDAEEAVLHRVPPTDSCQQSRQKSSSCPQEGLSTLTPQLPYIGL